MSVSAEAQFTSYGGYDVRWEEQRNGSGTRGQVCNKGQKGLHRQHDKEVVEQNKDAHGH